MNAAQSARLAGIFARAKASHRAALIIFLMAGDPDPVRGLDYARAALAAGADILEIGGPFSDPIADGPVIQAAAERALRAGASLRTTLKDCATLRREFPEAGLVLMSYLNPLLALGDGLKNALLESGIDAILPTDLDAGAESPLRLPEELARIVLVADSTPAARLPALFSRAGGFVYYIARRGVTGERSGIPADLAAKVITLQKQCPLPVAVGFGLSRPEDVAAVARHADGVIVGSALVKMVGEGAPPDALRTRVAELRAACERK